MLKRSFCLVFAAALAAGLMTACTQQDSSSSSPRPVDVSFPEDALASIDEEQLRSIVAELGDDRFEGRGPGSRGDQLARSFIAARLSEYGFQPAGENGGWEQPMRIVGVTSEMPQTWSFKKDGQTKTFKWWDEYIAGSGVQRERASIQNAEIVFVGYGIDAPEQNWDDFKGVDLKGKVLLMLNNDPDWDDDLFQGKRRMLYGRWTYKYESAVRQGAAGAIIVHTDESAGYPWQVVQTSWTGEQFELPAGDEPRIEMPAWLTYEAAAELARFAGQDLATLIDFAKTREFEPVPFGVTTSISFSTRLNQTSTANVLGVLEGSDPELKDEHVVITAHHDHLGISRPNDEGDEIYNGARDNASGVAQALAIAKALGALEQKPRRSILMALVGAEEQGLLGSKFYAQNPTVHPGKLAANINFDSGDIWGKTRDIAIIGKGKSSLEDLLARAAETQGRVVTDEPYPDKGYYYRSDQLHFARIGVPALYFKSGNDYVDKPAGWGKKAQAEWTQTHYHQPSDELTDDWSFEGMMLDAQAAAMVTLAAANADAMQTWFPGDEFEAARQRALATLP